MFILCVTSKEYFNILIESIYRNNFYIEYICVVLATIIIIIIGASSKSQETTLANIYILPRI